MKLFMFELHLKRKMRTKVRGFAEKQVLCKQ